MDKSYYVLNGIDVSECKNVTQQSIYGGGPGCKSWGNKPCMMKIGCDYKKRVQMERQAVELKNKLVQIFEIINGLSFYKRKSELCEVLIKVYLILSGESDGEKYKNGLKG